jgi:hypothetical protein
LLGHVGIQENARIGKVYVLHPGIVSVFEHLTRFNALRFSLKLVLPCELANS